jgi:hypothetical protein
VLFTAGMATSGTWELAFVFDRGGTLQENQGIMTEFYDYTTS